MKLPRYAHLQKNTCCSLFIWVMVNILNSNNLAYLVCAIFFFLISPLCAQKDQLNTFIDQRDNETYLTANFKNDIGLGVIIEQTWMVENLNYEMNSSNCYGLKYKNCEKYGRLYTWKAAQQACPKGWHLPSDVEWQRLIHLLAEGGINSFNGLLGGLRLSNGDFEQLSQTGNYWTGTEHNSGTAWYYGMIRTTGKVDRDEGIKNSSISIRCIKD